MLGVAIRIVRRRELAEEAVHDAFVQIWRHAGRFDPALGSGRGWVFAIVRNRAINMLRDTSREQPTEGADCSTSSTEVAERAFGIPGPDRQ